MFSKEYVINNSTGLHARPATNLIALCKSIPDEIRIIAECGSINPKSIIAILTAGIKQGTPITVEVEGENEQVNGEKIIAFLESLIE